MSGALAVFALAIALAAYLELLQRVRAAEPAQPWWFGYARDGVNLSGTLMLWGAYWMLGFPPAVALSAGMLTCLATYLLDWAVARALGLRRARLWLSLPVAAWVAWVALAPQPALKLFSRVLALGAPD